MKKGKSILIIVLAVFVILAITSFINTDLAANLTLIAFLCLMVYLIYFLIKQLFKNINKIKDLDNQLHNQTTSISSNNIQTNKTELENDVKVEDIIDIPKQEQKRKPLFLPDDIEKVYKYYSLEQLEEEINETIEDLEMAESELELSPDNMDWLIMQSELLEKFQELGKLKIQKLKEKQQELTEEQPIKIKHEIEVVGTNHTDAYRILSKTIRDRGEVWNVNGYQYHDIILTLQAEPDNKYDSNAILVTYENEKIGHLPKEIAKTIHLTKPINVNATIKEGFKNMYIKIQNDEIEKYRK